MNTMNVDLDVTNVNEAKLSAEKAGLKLSVKNAVGLGGGNPEVTISGKHADIVKWMKSQGYDVSAHTFRDDTLIARFEGPHGRATVRRVKHGTHAGSIRLRLVPTSELGWRVNTAYQALMQAAFQFHTRDEARAVAGAAVFVEEGGGRFRGFWG